MRVCALAALPSGLAPSFAERLPLASSRSPTNGHANVCPASCTASWEDHMWPCTPCPVMRWTRADCYCFRRNVVSGLLIITNLKYIKASDLQWLPPRINLALDREVTWSHSFMVGKLRHAEINLMAFCFAPKQFSLPVINDFIHSV